MSDQAGKGKATAQEQVDVSMGEEEDDSSDNESGAEEPVGEVEEADDDNMEEIDTDNIITGGRRTRGRNIDFVKAAEEAKDLDDDEDDDDDDFQEPDEEMEQ
ncbi:hypothetical protein EJ08DRAFT_653942 [Tothia fuscella]|uniref:Histone chaperone domain-containing protein n=1 Tax=Tothia fuscella TaxID=1048955 RepID=A0A9P4TSZ8_9PEZI|nr:hypothetical protein EJ08DRAFT_653942 [Tothia fuscella]